MKYFLIAGEASGDLHGSNLIKALKNVDNEADFRCFGGDKMKDEGALVLKHYRDMAIMGIWEIVMHLKQIKKNFTDCKKALDDFCPDVVVLIDYAGFNLRIAKYAKQKKIKAYYYISPKLWAWGKNRIKKIKKYVDTMHVILPFEVDFYKKYAVEAKYYGNPLIDSVESFNKLYHESFTQFVSINNLENKPIIALLAGSRKLEIDLCLPQMLKAIRSFKDYQFVIAGAPSISHDYYSKYLATTNVKCIFDQTYSLLKHAEAAIVTSGTATLETALFNVPQIIVYKTSTATFYLGQIFIFIGLITVKFFGLVNIILDRLLVKEFLQFSLSKKIKNELTLIINDESYRKNILEGYRQIHILLNEPGVSFRVASSMFKSLQMSKKHD